MGTPTLMTDQMPQQMPQAMQPQQGPPQLAQAQPDQPQQGPSPSDIENYAAAVHHGRLANAMNAVGDILGGSKTLRMVKNPDGSVDVQQVDATPGEKWGRVAAAALKGASTGFAVGQGPGGAARAFAASVPQGMAEPAAQRDKTLATAQQMSDQNQKKQLFNANMAMLHQQLIKAQFDNKTAPIRFSNDQVQHAVQMRDILTKMGGSMQASYKTPQELAAHVNSNNQIVDAHTGQNGMAVPITQYDGDGNVSGGEIWTLPEDKRHQLNTMPVDIPHSKLNPDGTISTTYTHVDTGQMENEQVLAAQMGQQDEANKTTFQGNQMITAKEDSDAKKKQADTEASLAPSKINEQNAAAGESTAKADLARGQAAVLPKPGAGGQIMGQDGKPLTGEAYLQASGVDPSQWNQIRAGANGDVSIPPPGTRNPQAQALRNAIMNYDPTYTDSRYATKRNFRDKGDAQTLTNLSQALAHVEEAQKHADYLNPLGSEGTKYQTAVNFFTNEAGKLVASGEVSQGKYDDLKQRMASNIPSIRKAAVDETVTLLGGRVQAQYEKYRRGAQQDLPVKEFFNPETQERLDRYGMKQQPTGPPPVPGPKPTPAPGAVRPQHSIATAMRLPINAGKTEDQVKQDLINHGYEPIP